MNVDPIGLVGHVLDGQFRVDQFVGEGGFSVVYRGLNIGLQEPIAIKCLKLPTQLGSAVVDSFVRRFRDESRLLYKLSQGNLYIVRSIASGTTIAPATSALVPYMILEWLEGRSLAYHLQERRDRGMRGRTMKEAMVLLDSAVEAIAFAHSQGVVHRDLNPSNIFLAETKLGQKTKVLDFGVAKVVSDHALEMGPRSQTIGQIRIFAPAYGAPEQFDDRLGAISPATDVYALALVVMEVLSDRTVMNGEHLGEYADAACDPVNRPTPRAVGIAVGDEVEDVLARAVAADPASRPLDAGEFWGTLKNAARRDRESGRAAHAQRAPAAGAYRGPMSAGLALSLPRPAVEVNPPREPLVGRPGAALLGQTWPDPNPPGLTLHERDALPELPPQTVRITSPSSSPPPSMGPASDEVPTAMRIPKAQPAFEPVPQTVRLPPPQDAFAIGTTLPMPPVPPAGPPPPGDRAPFGPMPTGISALRPSIAGASAVSVKTAAQGVSTSGRLVRMSSVPPLGAAGVDPVLLPKRHSTLYVLIAIVSVLILVGLCILASLYYVRWRFSAEPNNKGAPTQVR